MLGIVGIPGGSGDGGVASSRRPRKTASGVIGGVCGGGGSVGGRWTGFERKVDLVCDRSTSFEGRWLGQ